MGGAHLFIEARGRLPHRSAAKLGDDSSAGSFSGFGGPMKVTGQLGKVMNESTDISLTYARLFVRELDPASSFLEEAQIHLHVPEGATQKDGPSAGVTMTTALLSLALGKPVKTDLAMTGELTITGKVLKVGGIKEKIIASRREKLTTVILPRQNEADFRELKEYLTEGITAHFVDHYDDVYCLAFEEGVVPSLPRPTLGQPFVTVPAPEKKDDMVYPPIIPEPLPASAGISQMSARSSSETDA